MIRAGTGTGKDAWCGPRVAGYFKDAAQGGDVRAWLTPFIIAGVACLIAAGIALFLKAPTHREHAT